MQLKFDSVTGCSILVHHTQLVALSSEYMCVRLTLAMQMRWLVNSNVPFESTSNPLSFPQDFHLFALKNPIDFIDFFINQFV